MQNLSAKIQPPKYLRYFFYIAYSWYRGYKSERADAHITATIFITIPNTFLILFFIPNFFLKKPFILLFTKLEIIIISLLILFIHYILILYKKKWKLFVKEFNYLNKKNRLKGSIYLLIYLFVSIFLAFYPIILDLPISTNNFNM